jgi:beta-lactamase class A
MRRSLFIGSGLASIGATGAFAAGARARADAQTIEVSDLVENFAGIVGIVARTIVPHAAPVVAVRVHERFPAASIIKLTILTTVYRAFDAGTARPTDQVTLLPGDITEGAPVLGGDAHSGQRWQIGDLLEAMIMYSDNIASNALISHFGFPAINETIRKAGMTGTALARHFAGTVPPGRQNMNVTTPGDIATLLYEIERGSHEGVTTIASVASCRAMIKLMLRQQYREMIPAGITRNVPIANKTGELDYVRSDAAIVDPMGEAPYVLVILTKELDYPGLAYPDIAAIAKRIDTGMRRIASR